MPYYQPRDRKPHFETIEHGRAQMAAPSTSLIQVERQAAVAIIHLNAPPLNLVTLEMLGRLDRELDALESDNAVRVIVITGVGSRAFSAGSDLQELRKLITQEDFSTRKTAFELGVLAKLAQMPKATIASIEGAALGSGLEMAACCDLIIAAETAVLGLPEIRLGAIPGAGGTFRVTRRIGVSRASEMILLGDTIDAPTALSWGLVNRISRKGGALPDALTIAQKMAGWSPRAVQSAKLAIADTITFDDQSAAERVAGYAGQLASGTDLHEGIDAFIHKRAARFRDDVVASRDKAGN